MEYLPLGPIKLERDAQGKIVAGVRSSFRTISERAESGLADACGCYIFAIKTSGAARSMPWYVGKAERQSFFRECFTPHKLGIYNRVIATYERCTPVMFLYARLVPTGGLSRPSTSSYKDVGYLEKMLITLALDRNSELENKRETKMLRELIVPGLLNTRAGRLSAPAQRIKVMMGY